MKKIFLGMCLFIIVCSIFVSCGVNTGDNIVDLDDVVTDPIEQEFHETDYVETEISVETCVETEPLVEWRVLDIVDQYFGSVNWYDSAGDPYSMILEDNYYSWFICEYTDGYNFEWSNAILFDENGVRVED